MNSPLRKLFAKDIDKALENARLDEREKCKEEYRKEMEDVMSKVKGELTLKLKEKESELKSVRLRLQAMEEKLKSVEVTRQKLREADVKQRQVTADLIFIMEEYQARRLEEIQPFLRLEKTVKEISTTLEE